MNAPRNPRYPHYDVLDKRDTPSWDDLTRRVIDARLATPDEPAWCTQQQWQTLRALCETVLPQPRGRKPVPLAALVDRKIADGRGDGYRHACLPALRDAWRLGLAALDDASHRRHGRAFDALDEADRVALVGAMEQGKLDGAAWQGMSSSLFFKQRVLQDLCTLYYAHPYVWSDIGFGGPANPRGYVRMNFNRRDPWEAVEEDPAGGAAPAPRRERSDGR